MNLTNLLAVFNVLRNKTEYLPLDEGTVAELEDGPIEIDAVAHFNITVYNEKEILTIIEELGKKLSSSFNIELIDFKSKENLAA